METIIELAIKAGWAEEACIPQKGYEAYHAEFLENLTQFATLVKAAHVAELLEFTKHSVEQSDDWSAWVCPDPKSYMMKCCDCGLVHEAQFKVVRYKSETEREDCDVVEGPNLQAVFRMRRSEQWTPEDMAHRPGGLTEADALKAELAQRDAHIVEYNTRIQAEVLKLLNEKDALKAENERLRADAARWNFATEHQDWAVCNWDEAGRWVPIQNYTDIDAAIRAEKTGKKLAAMKGQP